MLLVELTQDEAGPLIVGTGNGLTVTASEEEGPAPQVPVPATVTGPDVLPKVTVMTLVPDPAVIDAPAGSVH